MEMKLNSAEYFKIYEPDIRSRNGKYKQEKQIVKFRRRECYFSQNNHEQNVKQSGCAVTTETITNI